MSWCARPADARTVCRPPPAACLAAASATRRCRGSPTADDESFATRRRDGGAPGAGRPVGAVVRTVPDGQPGTRGARPVTRRSGQAREGQRRRLAADSPAAHGVQSIPTLLVIDHGEVVARQTGAAPEHVLRSWLDEALTKASSSSSSTSRLNRTPPVVVRPDHLVEVLVDEAHDHRALADGGRHPLHRTAAHVTDGEHAGSGRLERQRPAARTVAMGRRPPPLRARRARSRRSSRPTASPSQLVCGSAPMKTNTARASNH